MHSSVTDPGLSAITLSDLQNGSQFLSSWQNHILGKETSVPLTDITFGDTICWLFFTTHLSYKLLWKQKIISGLVSLKAQSPLTLNSIILVQKFSEKIQKRKPNSLVCRNWNWGFTQKWNYLTQILQTDNLPSEPIFLFLIKYFLVIFSGTTQKIRKSTRCEILQEIFNIWSSHWIWFAILNSSFVFSLMSKSSQNQPKPYWSEAWQRHETVPESVISNIDICSQQSPVKQNIQVCRSIVILLVYSNSISYNLKEPKVSTIFMFFFLTGLYFIVLVLLTTEPSQVSKRTSVWHVSRSMKVISLCSSVTHPDLSVILSVSFFMAKSHFQQKRISISFSAIKFVDTICWLFSTHIQAPKSFENKKPYIIGF